MSSALIKKCFVLHLVLILTVGICPRVSAQGKFINHYGSQVAGEHQNRRGVEAHVQALVKGTAQLPCDLNVPTPNDSVVLVVWYKDEHTPIYSFDTRPPKHTRGPTHWKDENISTRSSFTTIPDPAFLNIDHVNEKDEGEYRCRIDFLRSPTKNLRVKLDVIVPPQKPTIIDERGKEVASLAGPYEEGGDVKLTCIVRGGKPEPKIRWWQGERLLDSTEIPSSGFPNVRNNQLIISGLRRTDQRAVFTCQASNNNISQPVSASAALEIYFRPLNVEILNSNSPYSAGRSLSIPCHTFGSRPPAKITWSLDTKLLLPPQSMFNESDSPDGNMTMSTLTFVPTRQDNNRSLTCKASNHLVQSGVEEATVKLNIYYVPILHLCLGPNLNPDDIEERDDVYFECKVDANPPAYKVLWKHNDQVIQHNLKDGIIMSNSNLALQNVTRSQAGNYSCVASNVEGDGESNKVELKIMYKPVCRSDQKRFYGVARHENAKILCEVESFPPPDSFKWAFNNSAESVDVPQTRFHSGNHHFNSTLTYTPVNELDYGTVMCWATNLAGLQTEPCVFHVIPAGKPDPPFNCTITNQTSESLEVECQMGFDGGQPQFFLLEVYDQATGVPQANLSATWPLFTVGGLYPGKVLKMVVYAANSKGRSDAVMLEGLMLKAAEKQTVLSLGTRDQLEIAPLLGVLVGVVTALLLITIVILGVFKVRAAHRGGSRALRPGFLPVKEKATLSLRSESEDLFEKDDKNPDVIPANKDSDYQLGSAAQTPGVHNSVTAPEYEALSTPQQPPPQQQQQQQQNMTPLAEAFMARDRAYATQHGEVTYAELALVRPNSLETAVKNGGSQYGTLRAGDSTIYAQIDHGRRAPPPVPPKPSSASPMAAAAAMFPASFQPVTVRTPLMGHQQESCV